MKEKLQTRNRARNTLWGTVAGLMLFAAVGCSSSAERPTLSEKTATTLESESTTTTQPSVTTTTAYYEKYGWDLDEAQSSGATKLFDLNDFGGSTLVAAGRCTAVKYNYGTTDNKLNAWEIVQNPVIDSDQVSEHEFTSFTGALIEEYYIKGDPELHDYLNIASQSVIDGEGPYFGSVGLIPNQNQLIDTTVSILPGRGPEYTDESTIHFYAELAKLKKNVSVEHIFELDHSAKSFKVGFVVMVLESEEWRVNDYCQVPGLVLADPPESTM